MKKELYEQKQKEITNAKGNGVEEIGIFKRIGREVYKSSYDYDSGKHLNWMHKITLDEGQTLQDYIGFLIEFEGEEG